MTSFPNGQLLVHEFRTLTEAHQAASVLSSSLFVRNGETPFRLVDVSMTAGGAWVCAWMAAGDLKLTEKIAGQFGFEVIEVEEKLMNALLSLGPKPDANSKSIGILESDRIGEVLRNATIYIKNGFVLLEVRVKRAGPQSGAYAFFALSEQDSSRLSSVAATTVKMSEVALDGDYRRYFL